MNKKILLFIGLILILGVSVAFLKTKKTKNNESSPPNNEKKNEELILFYGEGCPHCEKVEKFIEENKIDKKISLEKKEVYNNDNNGKELGEKAVSCGMDTDRIGLPFLWDGKKCLMGDTDIIDYLKNKASEPQN